MSNVATLNKSKVHKAKVHKKKTGSVIFIVCMLALSLAHFAVFWGYVNIKTIVGTFFRMNYMTGKNEFSFYWYKEFFRLFTLKEDPSLRRAFANTFYAILINVIIFPISLVISYAFYKNCRGKSFFRVVFYLPSVISIVALTMAYTYILDPDNGLLHTLFGLNTNLLNAKEGSKTIWPVIIFFGVFTGFGTNVVLMNGAMMRIPSEVVEAARLDGMGFWRELWTVTVPLIMPTLTTWFTMIITSVFGFYLAPMLIVNGQSSAGWTSTIPLIIYESTQAGSPENLAYAQTVGIIFSVFMLPFVLLIRWIGNKLTPDVSY